MCRNIKPLFNFVLSATDDEIHVAALQFARKISGFTAHAAGYAGDQRPAEAPRGGSGEGTRACGAAVFQLTQAAIPAIVSSV